jgi:hypothetical protein
LSVSGQCDGAFVETFLDTLAGQCPWAGYSTILSYRLSHYSYINSNRLRYFWRARGWESAIGRFSPSRTSK